MHKRARGSHSALVACTLPAPIYTYKCIYIRTDAREKESVYDTIGAREFRDDEHALYSERARRRALTRTQHAHTHME